MHCLENQGRIQDARTVVSDVAAEVGPDRRFSGSDVLRVAPAHLTPGGQADQAGEDQKIEAGSGRVKLAVSREPSGSSAVCLRQGFLRIDRVGVAGSAGDQIRSHENAG